MELEQVNKQVNWLDEERRKDRIIISSHETHLKELEEKILSLEHHNSDLESQLTRLNTLIARIDSFDESLLQLKVESKKELEERDKQAKKREEETGRIYRTETRALDTGITEIRKEIEQIPEIKRNLKNRVEEEMRLSRVMDELRTRIETIRRSDEEYTRNIRVLEDGRRQDSKRIIDLTGEVAAMRKRTDELSGKLELVSAANKKGETRTSELVASDNERRETLNNFLNTQALRDVERENLWKEWQVRFEQITSQSTEIESSLQALDATQRAIKRSQQTVDELSQKVDRRINEITEVQRLAEERFRQEWSTFKADDQKRWTNYILTMEEQRNETTRQHDKLAEKVTLIEDELQEIQDVIHMINEFTEKQLKGVLTMTHEWVSSYERTVGRSK